MTSTSGGTTGGMSDRTSIVIHKRISMGVFCDSIDMQHVIHIQVSGDKFEELASSPLFTGLPTL